MYAYDNPPGSDPSAVTGGLIVRDPSLPPSLQGRYLFADFYSGQLVDFIVQRVVDHIGLGIQLIKPWQG
jgi:hypothetical protein